MPREPISKDIMHFEPPYSTYVVKSEKIRKNKENLPKSAKIIHFYISYPILYDNFLTISVAKKLHLAQQVNRTMFN